MMGYVYFNTTSDPLMKGLDDELMLMLDSAHHVSSMILPWVKYVITSGLRTPDQNSVLKGAVSDSSHLTGKAADLMIVDDAALYAMLAGLFKAGFRRVGLYLARDLNDPSRFVPRHLHVDIDEQKPQDVVFTKQEQN